MSSYKKASEARAKEIRENRYPKDSNTRFSIGTYTRSGGSLEFASIPKQPSTLISTQAKTSPRRLGIKIKQPPTRKVLPNDDESEKIQIPSTIIATLLPNFNYVSPPTLIPQNEQTNTFYDDNERPMIFPISIVSRPSSSVSSSIPSSRPSSSFLLT